MNWGALKILVGKNVHRKDIVPDDFQQVALDIINAALTVQENEAVATLTLATSSAIAGLAEAPLPNDFGRPRAAFGADGELTSIDIQGLIGLNGAATRYFAISGKKLYAGVTGSVTLVYSSRYQPLVADSDTNDLTQLYSQVFLYALLVPIAHSIQDFDAEKEHQAELDMAVGIANANYALATLTAGAEVRSPYGKV